MINILYTKKAKFFDVLLTPKDVKFIFGRSFNVNESRFYSKMKL